MKKKYSYFLIFFFIILFFSSFCNGQVLNVGKENYSFHSINNAIDYAKSNDTILVHPGFYNESIDLYKKITLKGIDFPIISNTGSDDILSITANNCAVSGFVILDGMNTSFSGMFIKSDGNRIENNIIKNNVGKGLYLYHSKNIIINNNSFFNDSICIVGQKKDWQSYVIKNNTVNQRPILFYKNQKNVTISRIFAGQIILANCSNCILTNIKVSSGDQGITLGYSNSNLIQNNTFSYNGKGLRLQYSNNNTIKSNQFIGNDYGLYITHSIKNTIFINNILNNKIYGCYLCCNSNNNILYRNNFTSNTRGAFDIFNNIWYNKGVGNYWSDYSGRDENNDGIGDSPYQIPPEYTSTQDPHPIVDYEKIKYKINNKSNGINFFFILLILIVLAITKKFYNG